jgi:hypothetical protein
MLAVGSVPWPGGAFAMPDFDSPWKEAMDRYFAWFLLFFFPKIHALLDWRHDYEPLDAELRKLAPDAETGKRLIDKLIKSSKAGTGDTRLIHVEVQCRKEDGFARRMHVYNYRIEDVHAQPVLTLVVLGDADLEWRPNEYVFEEEGCQRILRWLVVKLLDFADRLEELAANTNLFGSLVVAHLVSQRRAEDVETRKTWKLRLLRGLYSRNLEGEDVRQWSRYIDWLLPLPAADDVEVDREIRELEKEKTMPFVSSFERLAEERANERAEKRATELAEKLANELAEKYIKETLAKAEEGFTKAKEALQQEARKAQEAAQQAQEAAKQAQEAAQQAQQEEARKAERNLTALHGAVETILDLRFQAEGLALMPDVRRKTDPAFLDHLVQRLRAGATIDDIRKLLA